jgi:transcriptional regulator with XRE-family HTH domain
VQLRIHEVRQLRHMTLEALGARIGRAPHTVWGYENGRIHVPGHILFLIAQALDVSADYLLGLTDTLPQEPREPPRSL